MKVGNLVLSNYQHPIILLSYSLNNRNSFLIASNRLSLNKLIIR